MDPTTLYTQVPYHHTYHYPPSEMYPSPVATTMHIAPQSFVRSSAHQPGFQPSPSQPTYPHPGFADSYTEEPISSSSSSSNSVFANDAHLPEQVSDYPDYSNFSVTSTSLPNGFMNDNIPRSYILPSEKGAFFGDYYPHSLENQFTSIRSQDPQMYSGYPDDQPYPHAETPPLSAYQHGQEGSLSPGDTFQAYALESMVPSILQRFSSSPHLSEESIGHEQTGSPPAYSMGSLQYPLSPLVPPQFVNMQEVSPSPTVSPDQICSNLPLTSPMMGYAFSAHSYSAANDGSAHTRDYEDGAPDTLLPGDVHRRLGVYEDSSKKQMSYESTPDLDEESRSAGSFGDSGESEREDDDDDDYKPDDHMASFRNTKRRPLTRQISERSFSPLDSQKPRLPPPVAVPNLTKKSRGRRVPTAAVLVSQNGVEKVHLRGLPIISTVF
ncbi:hypothetical protein PHLCEN_2v12096 [Hermanssonia centrifuga]|uniref:Uncharacterized protein n=1 Tax=Hermanssonia centrifuga TaxID=98765 RepID=A0A2R6NI49_9APHY|nr:hypothetical protein PHLCEN_2v12096 [Hermanssonia centrifuga]